MTIPRFNLAGRFDPARLFRPASVAVVGIENEGGAQIMANLAMGGFKGEVRTQVTADTHLAVLAVPAEQVGIGMALLAESNCFAAIVPGACDDLADICARTGVCAFGPHSFGLAIPRLGLNATRSHMQPPAGRLALISQSSALSRAVIDWAEPNGVGFSHVVGLGANAGIGFALVLDWLSRDPDTGAILLDIRRIKNRRHFLSAARAASRMRPVVAIRAGLRLLDDDGTAELAFEAALRRAGVLCVNRLEDLLAAAETLSRAKPARCDTLAIVSNAIGPGRLAADSVLREGLRLSAEGFRHVASADLAATAFDIAARPGIGGVLVVHAPIGAIDEPTIASLCHPPTNLRVPVLICAMGETSGVPHRITLARAGLPVFATPDQAVHGFEHLVRDHRNREAARELLPSRVLTLAPDKAWVSQVLSTGRRRAMKEHGDGALQSAGEQLGIGLTQDEALDVLAAYGIPAVPTHLAANAADAAIAADLLGYPVLVKLRNTLAPAERPTGGLVFDLHDGAAVNAAARLLSAQASRRGDPPDLLVQRHIGRGRELAIHVSDDATFGPIITFGPAGTTPDADDRAVDLPPLNLALARGLIQRSRVGAMLGKTLRDRPASAVAAVAETLVRISQLVLDFPEIAALDVPSLFADADGVLVADAWVRLRAVGEIAASLAIAPYPAELSERRQIGPDRLTIRPIRPEDAQAHAAFFSRLSPQDIRYRFFNAMRVLSVEQTVRMTHIDYDQEMAFVAVNDASETVGVSRLARELGGESGEFAVIVQADMKGRGLASHLMRRLIAWARTQGMKEVVGQILADNAPMLAFIRHLGFAVHRMADDPEVMEARLTL